MAADKKEVLTQKELNAKEIKENGFLNPYSEGVSYADFLEAVGKDKKVEEYLNKKVSAIELETLNVELNKYKNNLKTKE